MKDFVRGISFLADGGGGESDYCYEGVDKVSLVFACVLTSSTMRQKVYKQLGEVVGVVGGGVVGKD